MDCILKKHYNRTTQKHENFTNSKLEEKNLARYRNLKSVFNAFFKTRVPKDPEN